MRGDGVDFPLGAFPAIGSIRVEGTDTAWVTARRRRNIDAKWTGDLNCWTPVYGSRSALASDTDCRRVRAPQGFSCRANRATRARSRYGVLRPGGGGGDHAGAPGAGHEPAAGRRTLSESIGSSSTGHRLLPGVSGSRVSARSRSAQLPVPPASTRAVRPIRCRRARQVLVVAWEDSDCRFSKAGGARFSELGAEANCSLTRVVRLAS